MTIITVTTPSGRLNSHQRQALSLALTDAVLVPEVGQAAPPARVGFQVHFRELPADCMAIGGVPVSQQSPAPDVATIDVCVMDAAWPRSLRGDVVRNVLAAMAHACSMEKPSPAWWVTFRTIEEGSWGSRGTVLSILDLLDSGVFTPARQQEIRAALTAVATA